MTFLTSFLAGKGAPKIDYRKRGTLILTSLLEDLVVVVLWETWHFSGKQSMNSRETKHVWLVFEGKPAGRHVINLLALLQVCYVFRFAVHHISVRLHPYCAVRPVA